MQNSSFIIFAGPGRAGTTFVYELLKKNKQILEKNQFVLPVIKETYLFNNHFIDKELIAEFYGEEGIKYLDFSNLQYQNLDNVLKKSKQFDEIKIVLFCREIKSWIESILLFELRKGKVINENLINKKLNELNLTKYLDPSKFNNYPNVTIHKFNFHWIESEDPKFINFFFKDLLGLYFKQITFEKINESIIPKHRLFGFTLKFMAILLRYVKFYKTIEFFKKNKIIKKIFFKKVNEKSRALIQKSLVGYNNEIKEIEKNNQDIFNSIYEC